MPEVSEARVEEFLEWQRAEGRYRSHRSRPGLRCLLDVLGGLGVVAEEPVSPSSPTDELLGCFECYLVAERGLAAGTVALYLACCVGLWRVCRRTVGLPAWLRPT